MISSGLTQRPFSFQPVDFDFLFQRFQVRVGGDEFGSFAFGQRGGKGVGQTKIVRQLQMRGSFGQLAINRRDFLRHGAIEAARSFQTFVAMFAFQFMKHFRPVDRTDEQEFVCLSGFVKEIAHLRHARFTKEHRQQRGGVEDGGFHLRFSRSRSACG